MGTATKNDDLDIAGSYAQQISPLLEEAARAYGSQPAGSPARVASDEVNRLVLEYVETGAKMPALAEQLEGEISLPGLRRRVRLARAQKTAGKAKKNQLGRTNRKRGLTDPEQIKAAAAVIAEARVEGGKAYGDAVREAYDQGLALQPIADELGISYFSLWNAKRTAY